MKKIAFVVLASLSLGCTAASSKDACMYDKDAMLALDENAFDQNLGNGGGGWRAIGNLPGCENAAADLLAAYRAKHPDASAILAWHEGQMRASAGQYQQAIPLLELDRKPKEQDKAGWNAYVDATVAFLRRDRSALVKAREALASTPYPEGSGLPPLKDGYFEVPGPPGQPPSRMRWPPNIEVVDGLLACFGKSYADAYGVACRAHGP